MVRRAITVSHNTPLRGLGSWAEKVFWIFFDCMWFEYSVPTPSMTLEQSRGSDPLGSSQFVRFVWSFPPPSGSFWPVTGDKMQRVFLTWEWFPSHRNDNKSASNLQFVIHFVCFLTRYDWFESSGNSSLTRIPNRHMSPVTTYTPGYASSCVIHSVFHDDAVAGCSHWRNTVHGGLLTIWEDQFLISTVLV